MSIANVVSVFDFVVANWANICEAVCALIGLASVVVRITPNLKDDHYLKGVIRFVGKFVALNRKK